MQERSINCQGSIVSVGMRPEDRGTEIYPLRGEGSLLLGRQLRPSVHPSIEEHCDGAICYTQIVQRGSLEPWRQRE